VPRAQELCTAAPLASQATQLTPALKLASRARTALTAKDQTTESARTFVILVSTTMKAFASTEAALPATQATDRVDASEVLLPLRLQVRPALKINTFRMVNVSVHAAVDSIPTQPACVACLVPPTA
jgi:hypothetical protein